MGRNSVCPFVRSSVRPSVPPLAGPQTLPASPQTPPAGPQTPPAGLQTPLAGPRGLTDGRTEFLPILQDFVPCWGRCPATLCDFTTSKKQGKGTADLMMPFGVLF